MAREKTFGDVEEGEEFLMTMAGKVRWYRKTDDREAVRVEGGHVLVYNIPEDEPVSGVMSVPSR